MSQRGSFDDKLIADQVEAMAKQKGANAKGGKGTKNKKGKEEGATKKRLNISIAQAFLI